MSCLKCSFLHEIALIARYLATIGKVKALQQGKVEVFDSGTAEKAPGGSTDLDAEHCIRTQGHDIFAVRLQV